MASSDQRLDWNKLLTTDRPSSLEPKATAAIAEPEDGAATGEAGKKRVPSPDWLFKSRLDGERDGDRILFATSTRRMGDKTQVFPLERIESVRNRLTHSHEVAALARSIGTHLVYSEVGQKIVEETGADAKRADEIRREIPAIVGAVALAHDIGNPPFGHQGEEAIGSWITRHEKLLTASGDDPDVNVDVGKLTPAMKRDFIKFEGNAQGLRILSRLQVVKDNGGLDLTFATLAASMKYTVGSDQAEGKKAPNASRRKFGFFASEAPLVEKICEHTGLRSGVRHPLTHIMEACDDIAYSVLDAEDAIKKHIVSFSDLRAWLLDHSDLGKCGIAPWVIQKANDAHAVGRASGLSPSELNDVSMQVFRSHAIHAAVTAVILAFQERYDDIMTGQFQGSLLDESKAAVLCEMIKQFDRRHAYQHRSVLEVELKGHNTISGLMDLLWRGISERKSFKDPSSERTSPFARYAYGRISENYRRVFEAREAGTSQSQHLPIRYRELQLLCDMIAGMTDQFALDLHDELKGHSGQS